MAATQTHEVYSSFTDVQSYKLNDELIYTSLYTPLHENLKSMTLRTVLSNYVTCVQIFLIKMK
jgi:hypothetical protein